MKRKNPVRKLPVAIFFLAVAIFLALGIANKFFIINISSSMPRGIYRIENQDTTAPTFSLKKGDIVAVCLKKADRETGLQRNYILVGDKCENSEPLIKSIFAVPGDNIILKMNSIILNGKIYPYPTVTVDSKGRPLKTFPRGSYIKTSGYWLIGTNDSKSWDSRYWGPVVTSQILFRLTPFLTFR